MRIIHRLLNVGPWSIVCHKNLIKKLTYDAFLYLIVNDTT